MAQKFLGIVGGQVTEIAETGVTSVTGTAPVVSSGGATPAISMAAAASGAPGYLTAADWGTFNGKWTPGTALSATSVASTGAGAGYTLQRRDTSAVAWILYSAGGNLQFYNSSGAEPVVITQTGVTSIGPGFNMTAGAATNVDISLNNSAGTLKWLLSYRPASDSGDFWVYNAALSAAAIRIAASDSAVTFVGKVGFNNTTAIAKPTITGSRGANAALGSLLTALASYGLITDSTTA